MALAATTALTALAAAAPARAAEFDEFFGLAPSGNTATVANGVSADGTVVVGQSAFGGVGANAYRWTNGVMTNLGTLGAGGSIAYGVSGNGQVVVGRANIPGGMARAFRWSGGVMTDLGTLGGNASLASAASYDGSVVVGSADDGSGVARAFRWSGGVMSDIGTLGGNTASASGVSADGTVIAGISGLSGNTSDRAFRWSGGVMTDLGTLGGTQSAASAVSADGTTIVGTSTMVGNLLYRAFRWNGGTMTDLGAMAGGTQSLAYGVNGDGSVVVGYGDVNGLATAFRWKASTGMQSIAQVLAASGVSTAGWRLSNATGVSANGTVIVGYGTNPSGVQDAWLMRCTVSCGLMSFGNTAQSFAGQSAMGQTANAAIGFTHGIMNEIATQDVDAPGTQQFSVFGYGGYDSDPAASGTLGLTMKLPNEMVAGIMGSANDVRSNMVYDGNSKMLGGSAGAFIARVPNSGLQWLLGISGITLKGDISRGYLNGTTQVSSQGNTTANGYGLSGRVGWTFDKVWPAMLVTPFASYTFSRMHFNGYTETGGPFPAQMNAFNDTVQIARFGVDARYTLAPGKWLWGSLAAAHKLNSSKTDDITGTIIGLFDMSAPGMSVAQDWIETSAGVRLPAWKNGAVTASLTASIPANYPTTYQARVGISQAF